MGDAGVADTGYVPRCGGLTGEVPNGFVGIGELVGEESAAVSASEDAGVAPSLPRQRPTVLLRDRAKIENVDDQQVPGFGTFNGKGAREAVNAFQGSIQDVFGRVVVVDSAVKPLPAVGAKSRSRLYCHDWRDIGVPSVVAD